MSIGGRSNVGTTSARPTLGQRTVTPVTVAPHPNLILHLKGTVGVSDTGGAIDSWADQSLYGNDGSGSLTARPATGRTLNGLPVVDFDGTNDTMTGTIADIPAHHDVLSESRLTVYFVGIVDAVGSNVVWLDLNSTSDFIQWRTSAIIRLGSDANLDTAGGAFSLGSAFFMCGVFAGAGDPVSATIDVNGSVIATGSTGRDTPWGNYIVGGTANMAVAELQVYDDLLDTATDTAIRADLASTWGVTT